MILIYGERHGVRGQKTVDISQQFLSFFADARTQSIKVQERTLR